MKNRFMDEPRHFYHEFMLGMLVHLQSRYIIALSRESGFGRYDVLMKPRESEKKDAYILEFEV